MKRIQNLKIVYIQTKIRLTSLFSTKKAAALVFKLFCTPLVKPLRKTPPAHAHPLQFSFNNYTINGYRWNIGQPKKVLLLHGFSSAALKFDQYVLPLVNKGYEVLSFDAPAHGSSSGSTTNALDYSKMIQQVAQQYGPINSFIAHSFGGLAISLAAETMPHSNATKIVLIAPATETTTALAGAFKFLNITNKKVMAQIDALILRLSGKQPEWFSIRRAIKNCTANVLWVQDEDDTVTPLHDAVKVKEDNHSNVQFMITKGLGHQKIYHDAAVKKAIVDFL
jgi:pimeloyl-ACP methyl ester carboxylesterase